MVKPYALHASFFLRSAVRAVVCTLDKKNCLTLLNAPGYINTELEEAKNTPEALQLDK